MASHSTLEGFLSASQLPAEVAAKSEPKHRQLSTLKNGETFAVRVDGLAKEEYVGRKDSGKKVRWIATDAAHAEITYIVPEGTAKVIAKALAYAKEKNAPGCLWKVGHDAKNRVTLT